jgi:hypothetical protein
MTMARKLLLALGSAFLLGGCEGSPLQAFMQETFGPGQHLQTDAFITEIAPSLPYPPPILSFSPDGGRYAYYQWRENGRLYFGECGQGAQALGDSTQADPWFSPDGKRLAYAQRITTGMEPPRWRLKVIDLESQAISTLVEEFHASLPWAAWSPDGTALLYFSERGEDTSTGSLFHVSLADPTSRLIAGVIPLGMVDGSARWSPDGKQIAYQAKIPGYLMARNLVLHDLADGSNRVLRRVPSQTALIWSTDGTALGHLASMGPTGQHAFHRIRITDGAEEVTSFDLGLPLPLENSSGIGGMMTYHVRDLSPDHRWCILSRGDEPLIARELATGRHVRLTGSTAWVKGWTSDSQAILAGTTKGNISRYYRIQVVR